MKLSALALGLLILIALSAAAYWLNLPPSPAEADRRVGQSVLSWAAAEQADEVELSDSQGSIRLSRQADGSWTNDSYYGLPADRSKLSDLIRGFTSAKIERLVTSEPESLARLKLGTAKVVFHDALRHASVEIDLGQDPAPAQGCYLQYGPEPKAYLSSLSPEIDTDAKNWADSALPSVRDDEVARIDFPFAAATPVATVRTASDAPWIASGLPHNRHLDPHRLNGILSQLVSLHYADTTSLDDPRAAAARQHLRPFRLTTFGGKVVTIAFGQRPSEKTLVPPGTDTVNAAYAAIPAGPIYVFIDTADRHDPLMNLMRKRAFQIDDNAYAALPQTVSDLLGP